MIMKITFSQLVFITAKKTRDTLSFMIAMSLIGQNNSQKSSLNLILLGGDFNKRTGTEPDSITEDTRDLSFLPCDYELDTFTVSRNKEDVSINYFGQQLLKLRIAAKLRILNGRTRGDLQVHLT